MIRRELGLETGKLAGVGSTRGLRVLTVATLLAWLPAGSAAGQGPFRQEALPGFCSLDAGTYSRPQFVDLDGDGDLDLVVGERKGPLHLFENTGTSAAPAFVEKRGSTNPFADLTLGFDSDPEFVDLDDDADLDLVVGDRDGSLRSFVRAGTQGAPTFTELTGTGNPFPQPGACFFCAPELADLDGDGDFDLAVADDHGTPFFFANTGTSSSPAFTARTGTANPLTNVFVSRDGSLAFFDLDEDGDLDVMSSSGGPPQAHFYFENTGTSGAPAFLQRTSTSTNPFYYFTIGDLNRPALADLDGDFDLDVLSGQERGLLVYFASLRNDFFRDGFESGDTSAWSATVPP